MQELNMVEVDEVGGALAPLLLVMVPGVWAYGIIMVESVGLAAYAIYSNR